MPAGIVETAQAKVNLALHVLGRRDDGYHQLDSAVAFAGAGDLITVSPRAGEGVSLSVSGHFAAAVPTGPDNLICKAYSVLAQHVALPAVAVHLEKNLPVASGIGGGSADAAAALRAYLRLADAPLPADVMTTVALALGADVPVCLHQKACRMEGVGELLSPLPRLPAPAIVLVNPGVPCETAAVFKALGLQKGQAHRDAMDVQKPETWRNDLTEPATAAQPKIAGVLDALAREKGLVASRMSGSGATCFGLAETLADAERVAASLRADHPDWWVSASLLS
ncbi:4-(cytidine 5'-diphospho)-2-C-methyl-D-erythritol kinase [Aestuariivirga sp.]|uniref:4-(cytidine 5'-diphospho)-2-C-methyl-D-erythritol kinase n=1 Tax=Aestuariivirga sp. TaxID=2650926 RepID=UPI0039E43BBD